MARIKFNIKDREDLEIIKEAWKMREEEFRKAGRNTGLYMYGYIDGRYRSDNNAGIEDIIKFCSCQTYGYDRQNKYRLWAAISSYYNKAAYMRRKQNWLESLEDVVPTNDD